MTKRYRLAKELLVPSPHCIKIMSGAKLIEEENIYSVEHNKSIYFSKYTVENNPDWFTEIKEEEPIMVREIDNGKLEFISENRTITCKIKELWNYLYCNNPISQNSWSDNDMIEFAVWYYTNNHRFCSDEDALSNWKSKKGLPKAEHDVVHKAYLKCILTSKSFNGGAFIPVSAVNDFYKIIKENNKLCR